MNYQHIIERIDLKVSAWYNENNCNALPYHNLKHTKRLIKVAEQIARYNGLKDKDFFIVQLAAWFHDTGYNNVPEHPLQGSIRMIHDCTNQLAIDPSIIKKVEEVLCCCFGEKESTDVIEQILVDTCSFHFGKKSFFRWNELLRKECELLKQRVIGFQEWKETVLKRLETHKYQTSYCIAFLEKQKQKNIDSLRIIKIKEPKKCIPEKGVDTMLKIVLTNNQRISQLADNKAHILITVNSIILSAIISLLLRRLEENSFLAIPTFILITVSLFSMVFAILATRPGIFKGTSSQVDLQENHANLLFFGNFYKMSPSTYLKSLHSIMEDRELLYSSLAKEVYYQGKLLGHKYQLLRIAYNVFMFGLICAIASFIIAYIIR